MSPSNNEIIEKIKVTKPDKKGVNLFNFPVGGPQGKGILLPHVVLDILKNYSIFTKKKSQENSL